MDQSYSDSGIDISNWNESIDWKMVKQSGINFAVVKATEGNHFQDKQFVENWSGMKNNDIKSAAYHYFRGAQTAESQISNIKQSLLGKCNFDLSEQVLAIDVEDTHNEECNPEEMASTLWNLIQGLKLTFDNVYIYCSPNTWESRVDWRAHDFSCCPLWIAHWTPKDSPRIPTTWEKVGWKWWQYTSEGHVDGIHGYVDRDRIKWSEFEPKFKDNKREVLSDQ